MNQTWTVNHGITKGMKLAITGAISSMFGAGFSFAMSNVSPILSDIAAILAIIVAILTIAQLFANTRKIEEEREGAALLKRIKEVEFEAWLKKQCNNCESLELCTFSDHRPLNCKWKTKTDIEPKGTQ